MNYTLQACFDTLRNHKENKKKLIMEYALKGDIEVAINHYASLNNNIVSRVANTNKQRNVNTVRNMLAKRLFQYF